MPFMIGEAPIRRTIKYLEAGRLLLKDRIKICLIHYNTNKEPGHKGTEDFAFWDLPHIQYKNPDVQIQVLPNLTPTPFLRFFYDTDKELLVDTENKTRFEIMNHLQKVVGKSAEIQKAEQLAKEKKENPANFGPGCVRSCMCETMGQVPCPQVLPLPKSWRGKYREPGQPNDYRHF